MNKDLDEIQRLVQSFVDSRQPERAIELLENAIKSDSNFVEAWMLLSSVYRAFGQTDKAIEVCKKSLEHNPNDSIIWVNLGHLYQENNQHEQAFEPLKKALSLDPRNPSAWYSLGMALLAKKEHDRAIEAFQKTIKLDPNRINAWIYLASALDDTKQFTQAITAYKKALELQPSLFEALVGLGMMYVNIGDYEKAIDAYEKSLKINPNEAAIWFHLGTTLSKANKLDRAIDAIKEGLRIDPTIVKAWMDLKDVYDKKGDKEGASLALRKALATGKVDVMHTDSDDPEEIVREIIERRTTDSQIRELYQEARKLLRTGYSSKGLRVLNQVLRKDPKHIDALLTKANYYRGVPDIRKAKALFAKALELEPENIKTLTVLAELNLRYKYDESNLRALKLVDKALEIDPQLDVAWGIKGLAYSHLKNYEEAERCFVEALRINSEYRSARDNLTIVRNNLAHQKLVKKQKEQKRQKGRKGTMEMNTDSQIRELNRDAIEFLRVGDVKRALNILDKILKKDPNNVEAILLKVEAYKWNVAQRGKAAKLAKKALKLEPNNFKALIHLAELTMNVIDKKATRKAIDIVDKALEIAPQSDEAWALKGLFYSILKDGKNTKRCYEKALRINPNNSRARNKIGRYLTVKKRVAFFKEIDQEPSIDRVRILNFNNLKIRAQKLAKQVGFDPIAFKPLTENNMVYVHMDGNEENDDPNTHAWVSKETYEMLTGGTVFKGQKSETAHQRELIERHIETYLGGVNKILHDQRKDKYHIDIYVLPPNDKRKYGVMVTSGMSDFAMNSPPKLKLFQYGELYIKLPPDWPYPMEELKQDDYAWVFRNLYLLPRSVHENRTFFWNGQVIDNDEAFARNTELSGFLIKYPTTIDIPVEFNMLKVNPQKAICFYQLIPLYDNEMDFLEKHGLEKLYEKFDEYGTTDVVDLKRPKVC